VLTTAGAMQCWGDNYWGQAAVPAVLQSSGAAAIAPGARHTCALTTAGAVQCWGYNYYGETTVPDALQSGGAAAIAAGSYHTCALTTAGAVQCWGYNGDGETTVPDALQGGGAAAIAAGGHHTCALTTAGAVQCWGGNGYGQLAIGSPAGSAGPASSRIGQSLGFAPGTTDSPLHTVVAGGSVTLAATASGLGSVPVTFDTWTPDTCSVSGNTLTVTGAAGSLCGVRASRAGGSDGASGTTADAPQQLRLLLVTQATPTLSVASDTNPALYGDTVTFTATLADAATLDGSGSIVFCADAPTTDATCGGTTPLCSVTADDTSVTCASSNLSVGTHQVSAYFSGDTNNVAAASAALDQVIDRAEQAALTLTATPDVLIPGMTSQLAASGGSGTGGIDYAVDSGPCSIAGDVVTATGPGTCTVRATKAGDANYEEASATATITVNAPQALVAQPQSVSVPFNTAQAIQLAGSDPNIGGPYALTYAIASPPTHGTISGFDANTGTLTYTPNTGYSGPDSFTFTAATVNGTSQPATVSLTVADGQTVVAVAQSVSVAFNTAKPIVLTGSDPNPGGPFAFTYVISSQPVHGTITAFDANAGTLTYTPTAGYAGLDSFAFTVATVNGTSQPATVSLTIAAGQAVSATPQNLNVAFNTAQTITLGANDTNPGGPFAFTYAIASQPVHGTIGSFNAANGTLTYTPNTGYSGPDSFTFTAATVNGTSQPATVSLTIATGQAVSATPQNLNVTFNTAQTITLTGSDTNPGGPFALTYAIATPPSHGTISNFDANTGTLTYTPKSHYSGPDSFTFTVTTANGTSAPATVSLAVQAEPLPPYVPVPTLSGWALLLLFGLFAGIGVGSVRQHTSRDAGERTRNGGPAP
jgi:hypothetical protein